MVLLAVQSFPVRYSPSRSSPTTTMRQRRIKYKVLRGLNINGSFDASVVEDLIVDDAVFLLLPRMMMMMMM